MNFESLYFHFLQFLCFSYLKFSLTFSIKLFYNIQMQAVMYKKKFGDSSGIFPCCTFFGRLWSQNIEHREELMIKGQPEVQPREIEAAFDSCSLPFYGSFP